jgi:hypothetical protein
MTRLLAVIALGTFLLVSPAHAQVGNWLEGMWPTVPEQIPMPRADAQQDPWWINWPDFWFCWEDPFLSQCQ